MILPSSPASKRRRRRARQKILKVQEYVRNGSDGFLWRTKKGFWLSLNATACRSKQGQAENVMPKRRASRFGSLDLKAGEWVEVRSQAEILATLDDRGCLENMPFMPEMLQYCGQKLRVSKRADKTCQYIVGWSIRRVKDSVHLENVRCDGSGHAGCEAGCLIFWKEAWLKRAEKDVLFAESFLPRTKAVSERGRGSCSVDSIIAASQAMNSEGETVYSCQATEVYRFSSQMRIWDPRQYIRDLRSGNLSSGLAGDSRAQQALDMLLGILRVLSAIIVSLFNEVQTRRHGVLYPFIAGRLEKTPIETLDLQPGELVQIRSKEEIIATLDTQNRNRGLLFDFEMLAYCGGIYRVLRRVLHIIDEKTGKMMNMKFPCIILEGVVCRSDYHGLCPRAIYSYWRENWLMRASPGPFLAKQQEREVESCQQDCAG